MREVLRFRFVMFFHFSAHLQAAIAEEVMQNEDIAQISNPEEWARVNGRLNAGKIVAIEQIERSKIR